MSQPLACLGSGKLPVNFCLRRVASRCHCGQFTLARSCGGNPPRPTLPRQDAEFELGHVQPPARLGRVVKCHLLTPPGRCGGRQGLRARAGVMGVEVIHTHANPCGLGILFSAQPFHLPCEVRPGALGGDLHVAPARLGRTDEEDVPRPLAVIFLLIARPVTGARWPGAAGFPNPLFSGLVERDRGPGRSIGLGIQGQDLCQGGHKLPAHLRQTPRLVRPGVQRVFLST